MFQAVTNGAASNEEGMIFDMDDLDSTEETTEDALQYCRIFSSLNNFPQLINATLPATTVNGDVVDGHAATPSVNEDRHEMFRQLGVELRQISADFSRSRRRLESFSHPQAKTNPSFLVRIFHCLQAFALRHFYWLFYRRH